jgi:hypothetical protein
MSATPFIKPLNTRKGIFYSFQSATEDITLTFNNDTDKKFRFSKFALLRLPRIGEPNSLSENKIQFEAVGETPITKGLQGDNNLNLTESFQNYCLNFERMLVSQQEYDRETKLNVSERAFFKWLKELGAIRFRESNTTEKASTVSQPLFVEEDSEGTPYSRVVQYIGDIDVINSVQANENAYSEVYIHIPTYAGSTPYILFDTISDNNYKPDSVIVHNPENPLNVEYLYGRDYNETHPFGISTQAFFDLDSGAVTTYIGSNPSNTTESYWFNYNILNSYYTDSDFNDGSSSYINKTYQSSNVEYYRSNLDGITIDFDESHYQLIQQNSDINSLVDFNTEANNDDFEFNCVLIYYDVYNENDPQDFETNLYGVLFLDQVQQADLEFEIPYLKKFQYDEVNQINGNSFVWSINYKLDTSIDNVKVERSINDYSTFSLELYTDVLNQLTELNRKYYDRLAELTQLKNQVEQFKTVLLNTNSQSQIENRISDIEESLQKNQALFDNTSSVMSQIENVNDKIESLIRGETPLELNYNFNSLIQGDGLSFIRKGDRLRISNSQQDYNVDDKIVYDFSISNITLPLKNHTNYYRHETQSSQQLTENTIVLINDDKISWQNGQVLKLVFATPLMLDLYNIEIYTNSQDNYNQLITSFNKLDFDESNNTPIFEIVCINATDFSFKVDKIR